MNYPKFKYFRSRKHLQAVAALPCMHCGLIGSTQASHSNSAAHGKGRAIKASDIYAAALCAHHHFEVDQGRTMSRTERVQMWDAAYAKTVQELTRLGKWPHGVGEVKQ